MNDKIFYGTKRKNHFYKSSLQNDLNTNQHKYLVNIYFDIFLVHVFYKNTDFKFE